jgi:hypothetical protein
VATPLTASRPAVSNRPGIVFLKGMDIRLLCQRILRVRIADERRSPARAPGVALTTATPRADTRSRHEHVARPDHAPHLPRLVVAPLLTEWARATLFDQTNHEVQLPDPSPDNFRDGFLRL